MAVRDVVALHSLFLDRSMYDELTAAVQGRIVCALDYKGEPWLRGGSGSPPIGYPLEELAEQVITDIRSHTDDAVHLLGSSMGAYVAIIVASEAPDIVASCTLLGATADAEQRPEKFADISERLRTASDSDRADLIAQIMFAASFRLRRKEAFEYWYKHFQALHPEVASAAEYVFSRASLWGRVEKLNCPVLLLSGFVDETKPAEGLARVALRVPAAVFATVPEAGHTPVVERPELVLPTLMSWWRHIDECRQ